MKKKFNKLVKNLKAKSPKTEERKGRLSLLIHTEKPAQLIKNARDKKWQNFYELSTENGCNNWIEERKGAELHFNFLHTFFERPAHESIANEFVRMTVGINGHLGRGNHIAVIIKLRDNIIPKPVETLIKVADKVMVADLNLIHRGNK